MRAALSAVGLDLSAGERLCVEFLRKEGTRYSRKEITFVNLHCPLHGSLRVRVHAQHGLLLPKARHLTR